MTTITIKQKTRIFTDSTTTFNSPEELLQYLLTHLSREEILQNLDKDSFLRYILSGSYAHDPVDSFDSVDALIQDLHTNK